MKRIKLLISSLLFIMLLLACTEDNSTKSADTIEADTIEAVTIGTQTWMKNNLNVSTYRNGDPIPQVTNPTEWDYLTTGAWCYNDNDPVNGAIYGKLYNWYAVNDPRGLAPEGWHVPTDDEWKTLEIYLGMSQSEADKYGFRGTDEGSKLAGEADLWEDGVLRSNTNFGISGFLGVPGGNRYYLGNFSSTGYVAYWWSASSFSSTEAWTRWFGYSESWIFRNILDKNYGYSVRCVRD